MTHTVLATPEHLQRICPAATADQGLAISAGATPYRRLIRDLLTFFASTYKVRHPSLLHPNNLPLEHDLMAPGLGQLPD